MLSTTIIPEGEVTVKFTKEKMPETKAVIVTLSPCNVGVGVTLKLSSSS